MLRALSAYCVWPRCKHNQFTIIKRVVVLVFPSSQQIHYWPKPSMTHLWCWLLLKGIDYHVDVVVHASRFASHFIFQVANNKGNRDQNTLNYWSEPINSLWWHVHTDAVHSALFFYYFLHDITSPWMIIQVSNRWPLPCLHSNVCVLPSSL